MSWSKQLVQSFAVMAAVLFVAGPAQSDGAHGGDPLRGAKNLPARQKVDFILGQDGDTLRNFKVEVLDQDRRFPRPAGTTLYVSLNGITPNDGPWSPVDFRVGRSHFEEVLSDYGGAFAIGLEMIDYSQDLNSENRNLTSKAIAGDPSVDPEVVARYRRWVDELILYAKATRREVFLRIGYEFEGHWNNYEPESYKAAFRYIHRRIRELRAHRVATVWQTAAWANAIPEKPVVGADKYAVAAAVAAGEEVAFWDQWYPGDDVVDWMGVSQFMTENFLRPGGPYDCDHGVNETLVPPRDVQDAFLDYARAHNKPVIVAEAAPAGYDIGELTVACRFLEGAPWINKTAVTAEEIWNEWFQPSFDYVRENRDIIRSFAYINADWDSQLNWVCTAPDVCNDNYWGDSRVEANPEILARFEAELSDRSLWVVNPQRPRPFEGPDFSKGRGVYEAEYAEADTWLDCCGLGGLPQVNLAASNEREVMIMNFGDGGSGTYGIDFERVRRGRGITVTINGLASSPDNSFSVLVNGQTVAGPVPVPTGGFQDLHFDVPVPHRATVRVELNPNSGGDLLWIDKIEVTR